MFFCVFSQGATSSPPAVSAADSSAVRELAHSLKARQGNSFPILHCKGKVIEQDACAILHAQVLNSQNHVLKKQREENSGTNSPVPRSAE